MTDPWWEGKSEAEIQAHLVEVRARLEAQHVAELEATLAATTEEFSWPPMPGTAHPSLQRIAETARLLMARGAHTVAYTVPRRVSFADFNTEPSFDDVPRPRYLTVQKTCYPAPWTGRPYVYSWRVAVNDFKQWVASDEVTVHPVERWWMYDSI
jgi:hypothetical protein